MIIKVLGSSAGGAFPQWNCACSNCLNARLKNSDVLARTQSQVAISADGINWHLLNASPDLRIQIERHPELWPDPSHGIRHSPIRSVILTHAELDQILGLLLMRESHFFSIYSSQAVRKILLEQNTLFRALRLMPNQTRWQTFQENILFEPGTGVTCKAVPVDTRFPRYAGSDISLRPSEAGFGLVIQTQSSGFLRTLGYFPALSNFNPEILSALERCDVLFIDGTFWDDHELHPLSGRTAKEMGHLPLSGESGILKRLSRLTRSRKILIHINNTNPILDMRSNSHQSVREAGFELAYDGMEIRL